MADPKRVLITSANRGIGLVFAKHYEAQGWNVVAAVRDPESATEVVACVAGGENHHDGHGRRSVGRGGGQANHDPIDLFINNACICIRQDSLATATKADILQQLDVNAIGPWLVTRALVANLELATRGNNFANFPGEYGYHASKAALNILTKSLCVDLKPRGIACVLLSPGYLATDMNAKVGHLTANETVAGMTQLSVLNRVTLDDSGKFLHMDGMIVEW
ncbi:Aste57867_24719 [Aphanomyces stellatus]|uniref:Aste57867_24719 protein n=1 Tax=Aphanomyces stellatus TaxID=120398 RepID=A0A485LR63_9STRA|nr:hypothetical protein As57867_024641 [Aphanomyces stellatus]VFU01356.1 Aste57867_24719 [Aphanomyces stellatus]